MSMGSNADPSHLNEKIDLKFVERLFSAYRFAFRNEKPLDVLSQTLDSIKTIFGCQRVTIFPIDYYVL